MAEKTGVMIRGQAHSHKAGAPVFDAYVMVDWSAEASAKSGPDSIWWTCLERETFGLVERAKANPRTRAEAEEQLTDLLSDLAARGQCVLVGFDFCFGFPQGFAERIGARDWRGVWRRLASEIRDGLDNANNRFAVAAQLNQRISGGAAPFWGCPSAAVCDTLAPTRSGFAGLAARRLVETRIPTAKSVWQLAYAGNVGSQTLTGIARLERLRRHPWLADFTRVWPFETGLKPLERSADWHILLAEVYPGMLSVTPAAGETKDLAQVRTLARHFAELDGKGRLAPLFAGDPALSPAERAAVETEEGWILGVCAAASAPIDIRDWIKDTGAIHAQSLAILRREVDLDAFPAAMRDVVTGVIQACGMTDIADDLAWSEGAAEAGVKALRGGAPILVDSRMLAHGIDTHRLPKANRVMDMPNDTLPEGAVVAIGNAPTALFRLLELTGKGAPRPTLVLGFPAGLAGAAESKVALIQSGLPFICLRGRRGGPAMAAAAVNGLAGGLV